MDFYDKPEVMNKLLILTNQEDYEEVGEKITELEEKNKAKYILSKIPINFVYVMSESFSDTQCPRCKCPTIASVLDERTNKFVDQCASCHLTHTLTIQWPE
jgi:hypothetical protein